MVSLNDGSAVLIPANSANGVKLILAANGTVMGDYYIESMTDQFDTLWNVYVRTSMPFLDNGLPVLHATNMDNAIVELIWQYNNGVARRKALTHWRRSSLVKRVMTFIRGIL